METGYLCVESVNKSLTIHYLCSHNFRHFADQFSIIEFNNFMIESRKDDSPKNRDLYRYFYCASSINKLISIFYIGKCTESILILINLFKFLIDIVYECVSWKEWRDYSSLSKVQAIIHWFKFFLCSFMKLLWFYKTKANKE